MNCFEPLTTHSPSTSSALVLVAPASEPEPGSVRPKPASVLPATRSGSHACFCSSVPKVRIGLMPRPTAASRVMPIDWSTRPISSIATHSEVKSPSSPAPPNSSGAVRPNSPSSPIFWTTSVGKWCFLSHSAACGAISASANSRTLLRKASCSEDSSYDGTVWGPFVTYAYVNVRTLGRLRNGSAREVRDAHDRPRADLDDHRARARLRGHAAHAAALRGRRPARPPSGAAPPGSSTTATGSGWS